MMRRLLLTIFVIGITTSIWAEPISREQALRQAQQFFLQKGKSNVLMQAETSMSRARARGKQIPDYYYVFNVGQNEGFVIISGDDRAETVLGYSDKGSFDADKIPAAMADLLDYYSYQIKCIQKGGMAAPRLSNHPSVPKLMTVEWGQDEPFNGKAPLGYYSNIKEGVRCVTGCVATAMAQVLYHQRFVNATQAEITGYDNYYSWISPSGEKTATLDDIPEGSPLQWDKMVDNYYAQPTTQDQKDAVADLMLYCGTAVNMKYNLKERGSEAFVSDIPDAFKKYFGYSRGTRYVSRDYYSAEKWDEMIYNEIASGRPVIYGGQTTSEGGHAFIVHGYDGNGRYAINWGWDGDQDDFFYLGDLTPINQGIGGSPGGYNYGQEAVIYLTKEDGTFSEVVNATAMGAAVSDVDFNNFVVPTGQSYQTTRNAYGGVTLGLAFTYTSFLANTYIFEFGYGIHDANDNLISNITAFDARKELNQKIYYTPATGTSNFGSKLSDGTYYIKAYSREKGSSDWHLCEDADHFVVQITVTSSTMSFQVVDKVPIEGDANGDGVVNAADVVFVIEAMGKAYDLNKAADVNGDGKIDVADVVYIVIRIV